MGRNTDLSKTYHVKGQDRETFLNMSRKSRKTGHVTPISNADNNKLILASSGNCRLSPLGLTGYSPKQKHSIKAVQTNRINNRKTSVGESSKFGGYLRKLKNDEKYKSIPIGEK